MCTEKMRDKIDRPHSIGKKVVTTGESEEELRLNPGGIRRTASCVNEMVLMHK